METQTDSRIPRKIHAEKLCRNAIACVLFGIFLFVFCVFLAFITRYDPDTLIIYGGLIISFIFIYLVAPIFGLSALIDITVKWRTITNPDYFSSNPERVYITFKRFIVTSLLFSFIVLFVALPALIFVGICEYIMRAYFFIWFPITLIALVMALTSWKLSRRILKESPLRISVVFAVLLSIAAMALGIRTTSYVDYLQQRVIYSASTPTYSGGSGTLSQTIIIPTLDSPLAGGKNIIWCSTFQIAWNKVKDDVIGEPIEVVGAEELAARLNSAKETDGDIDPHSFYAAAGRIKQGIVDKIKKEMAAKFPLYSVPDFNDIPGLINTPDGILSYSYLTANVPFKYPYRQVEDEFFFTDSNGIKTNVAAFGVWGYGRQYRNMREQVEILFCRKDYNEPDRDMQMKEFAVDLCRHSSPYQVVAAIVEPRDSLSETLEYVQSKTVDFKNNSRNKDDVLLDDIDVLIVPEMFWEIDHRFEELLGKVVSNADPPMPIVEARQGIKFRLDRYGATLESEAVFAIAAIPRYFRFNRPFLVYMKKRDCEQPFFVMWIDNAELLNKK
jgi:hypothetical protein